MYESFTFGNINESEKDFLLDKIYEKQANLFIEETDSLCHENDSSVFDSILECVDNSKFEDAKLIVFESANDGLIVESIKQLILDYIAEAESDYYKHSYRKDLAGREKGISDSDENTLPNKKYKKNKDGSYKNPEKVRRAEIKYDLDDKGLKGKSTERTTATPNQNQEVITLKSPKETDMKLLKKMKEKAENGNAEDKKLYKSLFKRFCQKWNIDENSTLWVLDNKTGVDKLKKEIASLSEKKEKAEKTGNPKDKEAYRRALQITCRKYRLPPSEGNLEKLLKQVGDYVGDNALQIVARPNSTKLSFEKPAAKQKGGKKERFVSLGSDYMLIHKSPKAGLDRLGLKPSYSSTKYSGSAGFTGQYHDEGRVYFVLAKKNDSDTGMWGTGKHVYKLKDNVSGFYIDNENLDSPHLDRMDLSKLVGRAVYVKTDKPLRVELLK